MHENWYEVDGTTFAVRDGRVREVMTDRFWDPKSGGYMLDNDGRHIGLTSYENFGCYPRNARNAARWCEKAQRAWEMAQA